MKKLILAAAFLFTFAGVAGLKANDNPDSNKYHLTSIKWIKSVENDLDKDDIYVVLVGKVTKQYDDDTYFFNDGTGTIELDSDIKLPVGSTIVVRGQIDQAFLHIGPLEVEVASWRTVK